MKTTQLLELFETYGLNYKEEHLVTIGDIISLYNFEGQRYAYVVPDKVGHMYIGNGFNDFDEEYQDIITNILVDYAKTSLEDREGKVFRLVLDTFLNKNVLAVLEGDPSRIHFITPVFAENENTEYKTLFTDSDIKANPWVRAMVDSGAVDKRLMYEEEC